MTERLQKLISAAGLCSRRRAETWIAEGKVTVNGVLASLGDSADPNADEILVCGKPLPAAPARTVTVLLYKPRGFVTTLSDERGRQTVSELLPPELGRLYPVGRLDQFSEGLLLMTNDGDLAHRLTHPSGASGSRAGTRAPWSSSAAPSSWTAIGSNLRQCGCCGSMTTRKPFPWGEGGPKGRMRGVPSSVQPAWKSPSMRGATGRSAAWPTPPV